MFKYLSLPKFLFANNSRINENAKIVNKNSSDDLKFAKQMEVQNSNSPTNINNASCYHCTGARR